MSARRTVVTVACTIGLSILVGACVTYTQKNTPSGKRGLKASHTAHAELELECALCHEPQEDAGMTMPTHDLCVACHEFDLDNPEAEACGFCHTTEDYAVAPRTAALSEELNWTHTAHVEADLACASCHESPDAGLAPKGGFKPFCMDCHGAIVPDGNECSVCHSELSTETVPKFRGNARIAHDSPAVWTQVHGREAQADPAYCTLCHGADQQFCDECHTKTPPANHTVSWQRRTHGTKAAWERQSCATCHEEESCLQCHRNVEPSSHRRGWGRPLDRHCENCHYPPTNTGCTVCHESVDHVTAKPSPHRLNVYTASCRRCHPGGRPNRAPHPTNSTVTCRFCH